MLTTDQIRTMLDAYKTEESNAPYAALPGPAEDALLLAAPDLAQRVLDQEAELTRYREFLNSLGGALGRLGERYERTLADTIRTLDGGKA